ncbi:CPBP family intramembrane glutamic endopeptidase [uncultured Bifidobacterium sp.]|uniref:CPBP family intramembrane glutamic endopeptidase n=1 Tax=uncultured Bifidobacterium sp. TaxID=165187 RepID=UPI00261BC418|nr:CPBP family intramembrane glutamic endopeptidase [uncultured Bifidobacterium sp.]
MNDDGLNADGRGGSGMDSEYPQGPSPQPSSPQSGPSQPLQTPAPSQSPWLPADVARRRFSRVGAGLSVMLLIWIALQMICYQLLSMVVAKGSDGSYPTWVTLVSSSGPLYLIAMPLSLLVLSAVPVLATRRFSMGMREFFRLLVICFPLMYAGSIIGSVLSELLSQGTAVNGVADLINESDTPTVLLFVVILAPTFEEWMFRKQIIDRLRVYGERTAMVVSALAFALFHLNLFQFFYAFALGLVFAYAYLRTSRLRYSVAMHMIVNLNGSVIAPWVLSLLGKDTLTAIDSGSITAIEKALPSSGIGVAVYLLYALAMMALIILGVVLLVRGWRHREFYTAPCELASSVRTRTVLLNPGMLVYIGLSVVVVVVLTMLL